MKAHIYAVKSKPNLRRLIPQLLIAAGVLALFIYGFSTIPRATESENLAMTKRAVRSALINCYAIEGSYPQTLEYLEEHYGVTIDYNKYVVFYEAIGGNIMPYVNVVPIGWQGS